MVEGAGKKETALQDGPRTAIKWEKRKKKATVSRLAGNKNLPRPNEKERNVKRASTQPKSAGN